MNNRYYQSMDYMIRASVKRALGAAGALLLLGWQPGGVTESAAQAVSGRSVNEHFQAQGLNSDLGFSPGRGAGFRNETQLLDSVRGTITTYYPSGKVWQVVPYAHVRKKIVEGTERRYYESGQLLTEGEFVQGKRQGPLRTYYPSGKLRRQEQYADGKQTAAQCFGPDGQPVPYAPYLVYPEFPGGIMGLMQTVATRTRYPDKARRNDITGKVFIDFVVDRQGRLQNARVSQSAHPLLDEEALRVVRTLGGWTPGRLDGEVADVLFTVPVTFRLE
jgi:periplasmic protein TonB